MEDAWHPVSERVIVGRWVKKAAEYGESGHDGEACRKETRESTPLLAMVEPAQLVEVEVLAKCDCQSDADGKRTEIACPVQGVECRQNPACTIQERTEANPERCHIQKVWPAEVPGDFVMRVLDSLYHPNSTGILVGTGTVFTEDAFGSGPDAGD